LPQDYWDDETLKDIGNALGNFFKIAEQTKTNKYTSYARICIYMHIAKTLSDSICLAHEDTEWIQTLDYEHVPFRCHKCHEHGHLFKDCPQNKFSTDLKGEHSHMRKVSELSPINDPTTNPNPQLNPWILQQVTTSRFSPIKRMGKTTMRRKINQPPKRSTRNPCRTKEATCL
jgi:hypothetical protein